MDSLLAHKLAVAATCAVLLVIGERLFPAARPRFAGWLAQARRIGRNLALAGVNFLLSPLLVVPLSAFAAAHAPGWRPDSLSGPAGLAADLLVLDLWIYWWHRANHEWPLLWRFHSVHHLDEFLDASSSVRFHFGEVTISALVRATVIFVLAIPLTNVVLFETLVLVAALFHHSNLRLPPRLERALSAVIITPGIHWVHHHALRRDTDSNYGTVLSVWDRLFASASRTRRFADMPIGVEGDHDRALPDLLIRPFRQP